MNEICNVNWLPIHNINSSDINELLKRVSSDVDLSRCAKWKNSCNSQVVIQSPNYFYKIYEEDCYDGKYVCEIREALGQIY